MTLVLSGDGDITSSGTLDITADGMEIPKTANETYQIGATGDFTTINEALESLSRSSAVYTNAGITVTLNLQAGFVMAEQVLVKGIDLGWITITGTDAETSITHTALTIDFTTNDYGFDSFPAFGVSKGGTLPRIGQLFRMSSGTTPGDEKHGVIAVGSGSSAEVLSGAGVQDAGTNCCYCVYCAIINCKDSIFSGAGTYGVAAIHGAIINASGVDASGAGSIGIYTRSESSISADEANASGAGTYGIYASSGSTINADGANASGAGAYGIVAQSASKINASGVDASGANSFGIFADRASIINAYGSNAQGLGTYDYRVLDSSIIDVSGAIGSPTYSQTLNTWTTNGWIGQ